MKSPVQPACLLVATALAVFTPSGAAATVTKLDTDSLAATAVNWSAAPVAADFGSFDGTLSAAKAATLTLGGDLTIGRLIFTNASNGPLVISNSGTLTLANGVAVDGRFSNQNITIHAPVVVTAAGNTFEASQTLANSLAFTNTITSSFKVAWRSGNGVFGGGGSYNSLGIGSRTGITSTLSLGADNGISTSATVTIGEANGSSRLDLAGFNQSLVGITRASQPATIGNRSTTSDSTLTLTGTSTYTGIIQDALDGGTRKVSLLVNGGNLTLGGANTYSGDTEVAGGSFTLADSGSMRFVLQSASGANNRIHGDGDLTLAGDFVIDTTATDESLLEAGTWQIIDGPDLSGVFESTFRVLTGTGVWKEKDGIWTRISGSKRYQFSTLDGTLTLSGYGYPIWIAEKGLTGDDAAFDADPDGDGIANGLEFALGGEPNPATAGASDRSILPDAAYLSGDLVISFKRTVVSATTMGLYSQWSPDLDFTAPSSGEALVTTGNSATDGVTISVQPGVPSADFDTITITVPESKAPDGRIFGRLRAVENP
jgi:autotransporter-associated beta strand protein